MELTPEQKASFIKKFDLIKETPLEIVVCNDDFKKIDSLNITNIYLEFNHWEKTLMPDGKRMYFPEIHIITLSASKESFILKRPFMGWMISEKVKEKKSFIIQVN